MRLVSQFYVPLDRLVLLSSEMSNSMSICILCCPFLLLKNLEMGSDKKTERRGVSTHSCKNNHKLESFNKNNSSSILSLVKDST